MSPKPRRQRSVRPYTTGQIADDLGVNRTTAIDILERGEVPWYWSPGRGRRLVRAADYHAWKKQNAGRYNLKG